MELKPAILCTKNKDMCTEHKCNTGGVCQNYLRITERRKELINHPEHYGGADNPYEQIKVNKAQATEDEFYGWLKFTIVTYMGRLGKKDPVTQDLGKVIWYSNYLAKWLEETGYQPK